MRNVVLLIVIFTTVMMAGCKKTKRDLPIAEKLPNNRDLSITEELPTKHDLPIAEKLPKLHVMFPRDISDLHQALEQLADGGVLTIQKGTHRIDQPLKIDRNIQLIGETGDPEDVIIESTGEACLIVSAENARVEGLTLKTTEDKKKATVLIIQGQSTLHRCNITFTGSIAPTGRCGLVVYGNSTNPTLTFCKVFNCQGVGIYVWQGGKGTFNNCEVYGNAKTGIEVQNNGNPNVTGCKFYNNKKTGIAVYQGGKGMFDNCEVYGNVNAGIQVSDNCDPKVSDCKLFDNEGVGIAVTQRGKGMFDRCEVYGNTFSGIDVVGESNPKFIGCKFYDNKQTGIVVRQGGKGTFDDCNVSGNVMTGILVQEDGDPMIRNCTIRNNTQAGIIILEKGRGTYEQNTLSDNRSGNWKLKNPGTFQRTGNTPNE